MFKQILWSHHHVRQRSRQGVLERRHHLRCHQRCLPTRERCVVYWYSVRASAPQCIHSVINRGCSFAHVPLIQIRTSWRTSCWCTCTSGWYICICCICFICQSICCSSFMDSAGTGILKVWIRSASGSDTEERGGVNEHFDLYNFFFTKKIKNEFQFTTRTPDFSKRILVLGQLL